MPPTPPKDTVTDTPWTPVDDYLSGLFVGSDPHLEAALRDSTAAGLPEIQVSPTQGKLLELLVRLRSAKAILEIGTLGGYSAICMARGLQPGGRLITLEFEPKHAEVARANIARAGLADRVDVRLGKALDLLPKVEADRIHPFDLVFIDADKENNPQYFEWALRLTRPGSLILVDNVVREGRVLEADSADVSVQGTRKVLSMMASDKRVSATALQVVGVKGWDGLAIAAVV
jgi:predicted O-methyltransferase YrrM